MSKVLPGLRLLIALSALHHKGKIVPEGEAVQLPVDRAEKTVEVGAARLASKQEIAAYEAGEPLADAGTVADSDSGASNDADTGADGAADADAVPAPGSPDSAPASAPSAKKAPTPAAKKAPTPAAKKAARKPARAKA